MRMLRTILLGSIFIVALIVILTTIIVTPSGTPAALHTLITETHQQFSHLNSIKKELDGTVPFDDKLMVHLGFNDDPPVLYPEHLWYNLSTPVIVTAVDALSITLVEDIIVLAQQICSNSSIVVYGLDLSITQFNELESVCNTSCTALKFDFTLYPSHLKDFRLGAYRPIIIQELLVRSGAVLWLDPGVRLLLPSEDSANQITDFPIKYDNVNSNEDNHEKVKNSIVHFSNESNLLNLWSAIALKSNGVHSWPLIHFAPHLPTAAHTHPDMFKEFHTHKHLYDFQQMSDVGVILLFNTKDVHNLLMKYWVTCALTHTCISPVGAQDSGCRYDKKPLFRYTGCHLYDTSAFNVALGMMFGPDVIPYLSQSSIFTRTSLNSKEGNTDVFPAKATKVSFQENQNTSNNISTPQSKVEGGLNNYNSKNYLNDARKYKSIGHIDNVLKDYKVNFPIDKSII